MKRTAVAGIFVGGAGARMGGRAKGLLRAPDGRTIVERWCAVLEASGIRDIVLVGVRGAYVGIRLETIDDEPRGIGPLGGLIALTMRNLCFRWRAVSRAKEPIHFSGFSKRYAPSNFPCAQRK